MYRISILFILFFIAVTTRVWALDEEALAEVQALKAEISRQRELLNKQEEKLNRLLGEKSTASAKTSKKAVPPSALPQPKETTSDSVSDPAPVSQAASLGRIGPWTYSKGNSRLSSMLPDISVIGVMAASVFRDDPGANGHDPERSGFNLQEIELAIQSVIDPYVRGDVFLSFREEGVELEEGYITTLSLPADLQIRAGKMKLPFGRHNQKHLETWYFVNDNLINSRVFGGEGFNELAFVPSVLLPTPFFFQLEAGVSQGENGDNFDGNRKSDMAYFGRLSASGDLARDLTLLVGTSAAFGFNDSGRGNATNVFGGDVTLKWKPNAYQGLIWESEYIYRRREIPGALETEGGFSTLLVGQWSKRWQAGFRFDFAGLPEDDFQEYRLSPMLQFMPSEFFRIKAQYDFDKAEGARANHAGHLQAIFTMGSHGGHKF